MARRSFGVIGAKPPHLQEPDEGDKAIKMKDMTIDIGLPYPQAKELVKVGDPITIKRSFTRLKTIGYQARPLMIGLE